jgi:hypothetical protein
MARPAGEAGLSLGVIGWEDFSSIVFFGDSFSIPPIGGPLALW